MGCKVGHGCSGHSFYRRFINPHLFHLLWRGSSNFFERHVRLPSAVAWGFGLDVYISGDVFLEWTCADVFKCVQLGSCLLPHSDTSLGLFKPMRFYSPAYNRHSGPSEFSPIMKHGPLCSMGAHFGRSTGDESCPLFFFCSTQNRVFGLWVFGEFGRRRLGSWVLG